MNTVNDILDTIAGISAGCAFLCLCWFLGKVLLAWANDGNMRNDGPTSWFWAGFALFGVWMACQVGKIGF